MQSIRGDSRSELESEAEKPATQIEIDSTETRLHRDAINMRSRKIDEWQSTLWRLMRPESGFKHESELTSKPHPSQRKIVTLRTLIGVHQRRARLGIISSIRLFDRPDVLLAYGRGQVTVYHSEESASRERSRSASSKSAQPICGRQINNCQSTKAPIARFPSNITLIPQATRAMLDSSL